MRVKAIRLATARGRLSPRGLHMYVHQVLLLTLEASVMMLIILSLFRARTKLGLTPLYIVLGGFQYLEATLGLQVEVLPDVWIYPASAVLFTASLAAVVLVYIKEDAVEARKLVYGLVFANAAVSIISLLIGMHLWWPDQSRAGSGVTSTVFFTTAKIAAIGTTLLFIDVLGIILVYEYISRFVTGLFLRICSCVLIVATFDNVVFTSALRWGASNLGELILVGFVAKAAAAIFYSAVCAAYLRFVEPQAAVTGTGDVADVFQALTYRQKYELARHRMLRDGLTGLFNRGYFDESLPQAMAHARRHGEPLSLLMVDTDNFKGINDDFSHVEGDQVLRLIASALADQARANDLPCRYGGDEFVVLLSHADRDDAYAFAERFRAGLQERLQSASPPFPWGHVTTTIGIATYPTDAEVVTHEDLVRLADRRLYVGKNTGRDRVIVPV
jgi:diguanylate cyclase (GGDEF)-like protein